MPTRRRIPKLDFDRKLYAALGGGKGGKGGKAKTADAEQISALAKQLEATESEVNGGLMRLRQRKLLT